jgi:restriction system protein
MDFQIHACEQGVLTLEDLATDPDFIKHRSVAKIKKQAESGVSPSASPQDLIDAGAQEIEEGVKAELLEKLKQTDPYYFERVVLELFKRMGYGEFFETAKSGDGGIDGVINQDQLGLEKIYVQAKRWSDNRVREKDIRNFIGAMSGDTTKGIFVTTSEFDEGAVQKAREAHHKITLIDGELLADYMYKFSVGVQVKNTYQIKEIDEDFFENE